ncbi:MAG TPA: glycosyltransferase [Terriglobales bacterium]|nr:glycosyltransferase [Terriglobales bacterium]
MRPVASIVIRARNEAAALGRLLAGIRLQDHGDTEIVLVDSGSTDDTRAIAAAHGSRVVAIAPADFTYGRALNVGCAAARGRACVFVSAHCVPANDRWLTRLLEPLADPAVGAAYGKQLPLADTRPYEQRNLLAGFPFGSRRQTSQTFFHNANAVVRREVWEQLPFDETLPGLEDREWARRALAAGWQIAYEPMAMVYHEHDESLAQIYTRAFREGVAVRRLDPGFAQSPARFVVNCLRGVQRDVRFVRRYGRPWRAVPELVTQRMVELWGTYRGVNARERTRA